MKDWNEPTNKPEPEFEDVPPKHVKKKGKKKPFAIEYRYPRMRDWAVWKRYETRIQRDNALKRKIEHPCAVWLNSPESGPRYRAKDDKDAPN